MADNHFASFTRISQELSREYVKAADDPWHASPFGWIRQLPSRSRGAIGEKLVEAWAREVGFEVHRSSDSEADRVINGHRIEVKMSTLWDGGIFKFQQIRNQNYEHCFCLAIAPSYVSAWLLPKDLLLEKVIGHMGQHTGAEGADTSWIGFPEGKPYEWMSPFGDTLEDVKKLLLRQGKGSD